MIETKNNTEEMPEDIRPSADEPELNVQEPTNETQQEETKSISETVEMCRRDIKELKEKMGGDVLGIDVDLIGEEEGELWQAVSDWHPNTHRTYESGSLEGQIKDYEVETDTEQSEKGHTDPVVAMRKLFAKAVRGQFEKKADVLTKK